MTIQTINVGAVPNDKTGDTARDAFTKVNDNFGNVAHAANKLVATTEEAKAGTPGVLPDAAGVKSYVDQWGLGNAGSTLLIADLNTTGGGYDKNQFLSVSDATLNKPAGAARGGVLNLGAMDTERSQIYSDPNNEKLHVRHRYSNVADTWKNWQPIATENWVNYYGLGVASHQTDNLITNLDNSTYRSGTYVVTTGVTGTLPTTLGGFVGYGVVKVERYSPSDVKQTLWNAQGSTGVWTRRYEGTWSAWVPVYEGTNIVGTVSQSGGVPTGAIIESGSNANGHYIKYADGTMICRHVVTTPSIAINIASGPLGYKSATQTWTYPAAFHANTGNSAPTYIVTGLIFNALADSSVSLTSMGYTWSSITSQTASTRYASLQAIGRWY